MQRRAKVLLPLTVSTARFNQEARENTARREQPEGSRWHLHDDQDSTDYQTARDRVCERERREEKEALAGSQTLVLFCDAGGRKKLTLW